MATPRSATPSVRTHTLTRRDLLLRATAAGLTATALATFAPRGSRAADPATAGLDEVLRSAVARGLPGAALRVERAGQPLYAGAAGFASTERQTPLTVNHRFRLGSVAKAATATVVLQLVEEGALSLDDTVTKRLVDPAVGRIPNVDRITLRQLLNHTSGIYDYLDENDSPLVASLLGGDADWSKVWTIAELLAFADGANHAPYFEPGQGWAYSNTGYVLLGLIVERAIGHRLADEVRSRVHAPLALNETFLAEGAEIPDGTVDCYQALGGELVNMTAVNLSWAWACGWTVATIADFARFGRAVLAGELLSPASHREQFALVGDPRMLASGAGMGMGVWAVPSPYGRLIGMGGDGPGFMASLSRLVAQDLTVVVLLNSAGVDNGTGGVRDAALGAVLGPR
jgi:D-alanyl-D-alanine carboxypeptidase